MVRSYGKKKLPELFAPAIRIARDGFGMIEFNVEEYRGVTGELRGHAALYPEWSRNYVEGIEGGQPRLGALLKQPNLANTLEALGNEGPGLLYGGALGKKIIDRLTELGGCLGMDDLADFKAEWVDPVAVTYRGRTIHVPPPPCEAFQYLVTLRILEGFDLGKMERNGVEHVDTVLRAIRIAAGVRIANGVPTAQKLAELLSDGHIESLRARVRDGKPVTGPTEQWTPPPEGRLRRRPHHLVLDRRCRRQRRLRDPEPGQRVRLGRRRARHRRLPEQLPLLGRRHARQPEPREARRPACRSASRRRSSPRTTSR